MQSVQVQHDIRVTHLLFCPHRIAHLVVGSFRCPFYIPLEYDVFSVQYALDRERNYSRFLGLEYKLLVSKTEVSNILTYLLHGAESFLRS